ncbi:hypothetical protein V3F56_14240 [Moorellaceae bacterium AZ2]
MLPWTLPRELAGISWPGSHTKLAASLEKVGSKTVLLCSGLPPGRESQNP